MGAAVAAPLPPPNPVPVPAPVAGEAFDKLKVKDLKERLVAVGLSVAGLKPELLARLQLHHQQNLPVPAPPDPAPAPLVPGPAAGAQLHAAPAGADGVQDQHPLAQPASGGVGGQHPLAQAALAGCVGGAQAGAAMQAPGAQAVAQAVAQGARGGSQRKRRASNSLREEKSDDTEGSDDKEAEEDEDEDMTTEEDSDDEAMPYENCVEDNTAVGTPVLTLPAQINRSLVGRKIFFCYGAEDYGWVVAKVTAYKPKSLMPFGIHFTDIGRHSWVQLLPGKYANLSISDWNWVLIE
jgi:hypothetical protein